MNAKEAFYLIKSLKLKYGILITDVIESNFPEFYRNVENDGICDSRTENKIRKLIKDLNENIESLMEDGQKIVEEERKFKTLPWDKIIAGIRKELSLTQKELAKLLGVQKSRISDWETGKKKPNYVNCKEILDFIKKNELDVNHLTNIGKFFLQNRKRRRYGPSFSRRALILRGLMKNMDVSPAEFSNFLGIGRSTLSEYLSGYRKIPNSVMEIVNNIKARKKFSTQKLLNSGIEVIEKTKITLPDFSEDLSEMIAIMAGDGSLSKSGLIEISGNANEDEDYHRTRIASLMKQLFNKGVHIKRDDNILYTSCTSIVIAKFFHEECKHPFGKKSRLFIPIPIMQDKKLLKSYLRGLFDTDGTICKRNKYNIRISFGSFADAPFAESICNSLIKLGFSSKTRNHPEGRVAADISNDLDVIRFFRKIGSSNPSKIGRFLYWRLKGFCPKDDYPTVKSKLKREFNVEINRMDLPFLWMEDCVNNLNKSSKTLLHKLQEDIIKLRISNVRNEIDWKGLVNLLKVRFPLKKLTKELNCNYKTIWQWQKGKRRPNLKMAVRIVKFCKSNEIEILARDFI